MFESTKPTEQTEAPPARVGIFDSSAAPQEAPEAGPFDLMIASIDTVDESRLAELWEKELPGLLEAHRAKVVAAAAMAQEQADSDLNPQTLERVRRELDLSQFGTIGQLRQHYDGADPYARRAIQLAAPVIAAAWASRPESGYAGFVASLKSDLAEARHSPELEQAQAELEKVQFQLRRAANATRRRLGAGLWGKRNQVLDRVDSLVGAHQDRAGLVDTRSAHHRIFG